MQRVSIYYIFFGIISVLCGPPGSGKTMTLFSALRALPDMEVVGLNFSSATTPELLLKTFDHYCESVSYTHLDVYKRQVPY